MSARRRPPNVFQLLFFQAFCAAFPTGILFFCTLATQKTITFEGLVGYSVVLLIGLGVFLSTLADVMVERGIGMDWWGILTFVLLCFFVAGASIGMFADALADRGIPLRFNVWLSLQIGFTMMALFYCAITKSSLLNSERSRHEKLEVELESLRQHVHSTSNEHTEPNS